MVAKLSKFNFRIRVSNWSTFLAKNIKMLIFNSILHLFLRYFYRKLCGWFFFFLMFYCVEVIRCFLCNNISVLDRRSACNRDTCVQAPRGPGSLQAVCVAPWSTMLSSDTRLWNTWCLRFLLSHCSMNRVESNLGSGLYSFTNKWTWSLANQLISQPLQNEKRIDEDTL